MSQKTPTAQHPQTDIEEFTVDEREFAADVAAANAMSDAARTLTQERIDMNQMLGRVQATQAIAAMLDSLSLAQIAQIKETKAYRHFHDQTMMIDGIEVRLSTWEGFCAAIGGSRRSIEEKLDNLQLLGESALARAQELGMTTRELRRLRKLDESDQKVIVGELEAAVGDKEAIIDLITEMSTKHAKNKDALEKQLEDQQAEAKASTRILQDKDKKIAELQKQIIKQESRSIDEQHEEALLRIGRAMIDALSPLAGLEDAITGALETGEAALRLRAANALHEMKAAIEELQLKYELAHVQPVDDSWMNGINDLAEAEE